MCFVYNAVLHIEHAAYCKRGLHKFAGVSEQWMQTGPWVFMNFPSATISAAEFPLVYPEVNNLWEDKSVCGRELDSQTVEGGWLAGNPPTHPPSPSTPPPRPN